MDGGHAGAGAAPPLGLNPESRRDRGSAKEPHPLLERAAREHARAYDAASGRTGEVRALVCGYVDPSAMPQMRRPRDLVFLRPEGGGREFTTSPEMVRVIGGGR